MNKNYETLNLAAQKTEAISHYKVFKLLTQLKKKPVIAQGTLKTSLYCYNCNFADNILGVVRRDGASVVVLLVNFDDTEVFVDVKYWLEIPEQLIIYAPSVHSNLRPGEIVDTELIHLPGSTSVVLATEDLFDNE